MYEIEQTESHFKYPPEFKMMPIDEQVKRLRRLTRCELDADETFMNRSFPENSEGWMAILNYMPSGESMGEVSAGFLRAAGMERGYENICSSMMDEQHLKRHPDMARLLKKLAGQQANRGRLIAPCQFGIKLAGCSARRGRELANDRQKWGGARALCLDSMNTIAQLYIHPDRLKGKQDLRLLIAGDQFSYNGDGKFKCCTSVSCFDGKLHFASQEEWGYSPAFGIPTVLVNE